MDEKYYRLISRFLAGEATEKESEQLEKWLNESDQNRQLFEKLETVWQKVPLPGPQTIPPFTEIWQGIEKKIEIEKLQSFKVQQRSQKSWSRLFKVNNFSFRYAAVAAMLVVFSSIFLYQYVIKNWDVQTIRTQIAEKRTILLPDGSKVMLNADTQIRFHKDLDGLERTLFLEGQAFFDVQKDGRPFVIHTDNAQVKVLGTSFDVQARQQKTKVIVKSGQVRLISKTGPSDKGVLLHKNEMSTCLKGSLPVTPVTVDANYLLGWLENKHVFVQTPLYEIVDELGRSFNIKIKIVNSSIGRLQLSGEFCDQSPADILDSICLALDLQYELVNSVYIISE